MTERTLTILLLTAAILAGCAAPPPAPSATPRAALCPAPHCPQLRLYRDSDSGTADVHAHSMAVWIDASVPATVRERVMATLAGRATVVVSSPEGADLRIGPDLPVPVAEWVYAIVAPFPTLADELSWSDFEAFWAGDPMRSKRSPGCHGADSFRHGRNAAGTTFLARSRC